MNPPDDDLATNAVLQALPKDEYLATQTQLLAIAGLLARLPLDRFVATAKAADALGPFADPTAWRAGHAKLAAIIRIASAAADVARALEELRALGPEAPGQDRA